MRVYQPPQALNFMAGMKDFWQRGGFQTGLNPAIRGRIWYVTGEQLVSTTEQVKVGSNSNTGSSPNNSFATMARAFQFVDQYDIIVVSGVLREQVTAPLGVKDVTIIGAGGRPRQATSNGVANGGGATWLPPSTNPTAATALLELIEQGWTVENIFFAPHTSSPGIQLTRAEDAVHPDPSHATIRGCRFQGGNAGAIGIQDSGGCYNTEIGYNIFSSLGGHAIKGIAGAGIANCLENYVHHNSFMANTNDIEISSSYGRYEENDHKNTTTAKIKFTAGDHTRVHKVRTGVNNAGYSIAGGFVKSGANDIWRVFVSDVAADIVAQPA